MAKSPWRAAFREYTDDVRVSLHLMTCLDRVNKSLIAKYWNKNFLLDVHRIKDEHILRVISSGKNQWTDYHQTCLFDYQTFSGDFTHAAVVDANLRDGLDGVFWKKQKI